MSITPEKATDILFTTDGWNGDDLFNLEAAERMGAEALQFIEDLKAQVEESIAWNRAQRREKWIGKSCPTEGILIGERGALLRLKVALAKQNAQALRTIGEHRRKRLLFKKFGRISEGKNE